MVEKNFRLVIEYDGTCFHGWQRQKEDRTVQAEIENALQMITRQPVVLNGSGRTDAGVHALGQVASFRCTTHLGPEVFQKGLNSLLPSDVVILSCEAVSPAFHARYDARGKTYAYRILNRELAAAVGRGYAWHIRKPLDLGAMKTATRHIIGTRDFKAFEATGSPRSHTTRTVTRAEWTQRENDFLEFIIEADGFLRYMVRNLVGTLVAVGLGKIDPVRFETILQSRDRRLAGATAPPHGLFLRQVAY
jgi:tRNA pseudouridine38-40 synthase